VNTDETTPRTKPLAHANVSNAAHAVARRLLKPGEKLSYIGESPLCHALAESLILGVVLLLVTAFVWKQFGFSLGLSYESWFGVNVSRTPPALAVAIAIIFLLFASVPLFSAAFFLRRARRKVTRAVMLTDRRLLVFEVEEDPRAPLHVVDMPLADIRSSTAVKKVDGSERWTVNAHWPNSETSETTGRVFFVKAGAKEAEARLEALLAAREASLSAG
jgi:hypothetical protein